MEPPIVDVFEEKDDIVVKAELPGIEKVKIEVNLTDHTLTIKGNEKRRTFAKRDQFAPELIYFSDCILNAKEPEPSGAEGMADVRVINGLYRSAENQSPVTLSDFAEVARPAPSQEITRPAIKKPPLYHAEAPSRD